MPPDAQQPQTPAPEPQAPNPAPDNQPAAPPEDDWKGAYKDFVTDKGVDLTIPKGEEPANESAKPTEGSEKTSETQADPNGKKPDAAQGTGDDSKAQAPGDSSAVRDARQIQREIQQDHSTVLAEIKKELFSDIPERLEDADGDPIRTIEDVQKLINPRTRTTENPDGRLFNEEEAAIWLLAAQQHLGRQREEANVKAEKIADVNLTIGDEAASVRSKYGDLLKTNPNGVREKIAAAYNKTLVLDEKKEYILEAPVSLLEFYEAALAPYAAVAEQLVASEEEAAKAKKEVVKVQDRSDRQDIYGGGNSNVEDPEEAGWSRAAKDLYEN